LAAPEDRALDRIGGSNDRHVFPDPKYHPTRAPQPSIRVTVARAVVSDLLAPPTRVVLRRGAMDWAAVPETAVQEDREPHARKHDVDRPAPIVWDERSVYSETKTAAMQL